MRLIRNFQIFRSSLKNLKQKREFGSGNVADGTGAMEHKKLLYSIFHNTKYGTKPKFQTLNHKTQILLTILAEQLHNQDTQEKMGMEGGNI